MSTDANDEEREPNDGDTGELAGEPDLSKLRLGPDSTVSAESFPAGAAVEHVGGLTLVSYPKSVEVPREATVGDRVLLRIRERRQRHDEREGYFRDYKDGTARPSDPIQVIEALANHEAAVKSVTVTWRHKLNVALTLAMAEHDEKKLAEKLTEVSAILVAWQEAIELRGSKARILAEQGAVRYERRADGTYKKHHLMPWWKRLLKALRLLR